MYNVIVLSTLSLKRVHFPRNETLRCDHSNESSRQVYSSGAVCFLQTKPEGVTTQIKVRHERIELFRVFVCHLLTFIPGRKGM